jgi:hypothetical protein
MSHKDFVEYRPISSCQGNVFLCVIKLTSTLYALTYPCIVDYTGTIQCIIQTPFLLSFFTLDPKISNPLIDHQRLPYVSIGFVFICLLLTCTGHSIKHDPTISIPNLHQRVNHCRLRNKLIHRAICSKVIQKQHKIWVNYRTT